MNYEGRCKQCKHYDEDTIMIECYYCDPEFGEDRFEVRSDLEDDKAGMKQGMCCDAGKGCERDA